MVKNLPADAGDVGSIPGSGRFPGGGNGNPLQYPYLGNPFKEDPGRLRSMGSQRVGHNSATEHRTQGVQIRATERQQVTSLRRDLDDFRK